MRFVGRALAAILFLSPLTLQSIPHTDAHPANAVRVTSAYMSTDPAYESYDTSDTKHTIAPPKVTSFPTNVEYLGVYFSYSGAEANKTIVRVDFVQGSKVVRRGQDHKLLHNSGDSFLDLPNNDLLSLGNYQAKIYIDNAVASTLPFSLIRTITVKSAYMITGKSFDDFNPDSNNSDPAKVTTFPANVTRVGLYYSYKDAKKGDSYYAAVYDKYGALVHRSQNHTLSYVPNGDLVLILGADSGSYPAGTYRTDIYNNGAMIMSVPWTAK